MKYLLVTVLIVMALLTILLIPYLLSPEVIAANGDFTVVDGIKATFILIVLAPLAAWWTYYTGDAPEKEFLLNVFLGGLALRLLLGIVIFTLGVQVYFGGDALTYDYFGLAQLNAWGGDKVAADTAAIFTGKSGSGAAGWGMLYLVGGVYGITGRNLLAIQFVNAIVGAVTAPVIYFCARTLFQNLRVARISALLVAFFPSLVLWSAQGLKDAPIILLISLAILLTLRLNERLHPLDVIALILVLFGLLSMRFYIFYMMIIAIAGSFFISKREVTALSFIRQLVLMGVMGAGLLYLGVNRVANRQLDRIADLEQLQNMRSDAAQAGSGFGKDVDVSTAGGALSAIPIGVVYLLFAPFPWQLGNLRQSITLPEMLVWWSLFPMLVVGLYFVVRYRLRQAAPILMFTAMLTLGYSLVQGNVGTAYRQRAQLLVFYFIFVAVGLVLFKEKKEARRLREQTKISG